MSRYRRKPACSQEFRAIGSMTGEASLRLAADAAGRVRRSCGSSGSDSGPIELRRERHVIGGLFKRRQRSLRADFRRENRTRPQRAAIEQVVDELGLLVRIAGADAGALAMRVVETFGEQGFDHIA